MKTLAIVRDDLVWEKELTIKMEKHAGIFRKNLLEGMRWTLPNGGLLGEPGLG